MGKFRSRRRLRIESQEVGSRRRAEVTAPSAATADGLRSLILASLFVIGSVLVIDVSARSYDALTAHHLLWLWLRGDALDDSWAPMIRAYTWFQEPHQSTLYQDIFFSQHVKFQYPP